MMNGDDELKAVVIGGSAGSLEALSMILPALPADFARPIMVVVHLPPAKESVLPDVLRGKCAIDVREARDKEPLEAGAVYFAPPDYHLLVEPDHRLSLSCDDPEMYSRPSIDVLFESAADVFGENLTGLILSGANNDGARGLKAVIAEGGVGLVQSPGSAHASAMPAAALEACGSALPLTPDEIAAYLRRSDVES